MPSKRGRVYSEKHDPKARPDPVLSKEIRKRLKDHAIPCAAAFNLVRNMKVTPLEVGKTADLLDISISACQLGLFGYKQKKKIIKAENTTDKDLIDGINASLQNERLHCIEAWKIAKRFDVTKLKVGNVALANGIKIKYCQLGVF